MSREERRKLIEAPINITRSGGKAWGGAITVDEKNQPIYELAHGSRRWVLLEDE